MEENNENIIDANVISEETIEESFKDRVRKHLTKENLKKIGIAAAAMAGTALFARHVVSHIEEDSWIEGYAQAKNDFNINGLADVYVEETDEPVDSEEESTDE